MNYKSKFGFGCMRLPVLDKNDPSSVNQELFNQMVDIYMEKGYNYFDTSYITTGKVKPPLKKPWLRDTLVSPLEYVIKYLHGSLNVAKTMKNMLTKCLNALELIILMCFLYTISMFHGLNWQKTTALLNISGR